MTVTAPAPPDRQSPRMSLGKAKWVIGGALLALGATAVVARIDPNLGGYPPCPLQAMTGLDCPGCGGLRCVHALTQGDLATAVDQNLLAVILLPIVAIWIAGTLVMRLRGSSGAFAFGLSPVAVRVLWISLIGIALVFSVVRNIPSVGFLQSGIG